MIVMAVSGRGRAKFAASALPISDRGATQQTGMLSQCAAHNTWWMRALCYTSENRRKSFLSWRVELKACHFNYPSNFLLNCTLYVDPLEGPPTQLAWFVGSTYKIKNFHKKVNIFLEAAVAIISKVLKNSFHSSLALRGAVILMQSEPWMLHVSFCEFHGCTDEQAWGLASTLASYWYYMLVSYPSPTAMQRWD